MAEFQVRAATPEDVTGVVALDRATELLPHWAPEEYGAALAQDNGNIHRCLFVALRLDELAGFAVGMAAVVAEDVIAELESVAVAERSRGIGAGSALCAEVIAWAHSRGARQIELEVRSKNAGAIRFYERLGFIAVGRRPSYYRKPGDDAVLMRRQI